MNLSLQRVDADEQIAGPSLRPSVARQLRVAIVSDAIAGRNGVGTYYLDLIEHLKPAVESVRLLGPSQDRDQGLERFSVPMLGDLTQRMSWPNVGRLYRELDQQRPNLIVIPSIGAFSYYALKYARRKQVPFVLVNHTNFDQLLSLYWPHLISRPLHWSLSKLSRWLIGQATAVAAMNVDALEEARDQGATMVRVMGTPIPPEFMQTPLCERRETISRAIFVGRLAAEKGIDQILAAVRESPQIEFTIAGDGPCRAKVRRIADECPNLTYLGWCDRASVLTAIDQADLLMLPSTVETFGTVALEALARQRYVLVRRECGIAKWSSIAQGLFFIEPGETLSDSLRRLDALPAQARDSVAARSWNAVKVFNDHTVRVWLKFLADAAERSSDGKLLNEGNSLNCDVEPETRGTPASAQRGDAVESLD